MKQKNEYIEEKVRTFGQIFTPKSFAQEMVDTIPNDFWENPDIKIIDNSCGQGVFLDIVRDKLLEHGHSLEHILNNMIYGVELQKDNFEYCKTLGYKNLHNGDALTFNYWNIDGFDLVVGNPPYNKDKNKVVEISTITREYNDGYKITIDTNVDDNDKEIITITKEAPDGSTEELPVNTTISEDNIKNKITNVIGSKVIKRKTGNSTNPLWGDFVELSIELLSEKGYLLFVHPTLWRKPKHKLWKNYFSKYQILFTKFYDLDEATTIFNAGTKVDYYLIQKTPSTKPTTIIDTKKVEYQINVSDKPFIPNHSIDEVYKLFSGKCDIIYDCYYHHYTWGTKASLKPEEIRVKYEKDETFKYPCVNLINNKGIHFTYAKEKNEKHFVPKVIISMGKFKPILDHKGEYGMGEIIFGIPITSKEQGEKIIKELESETFENIIDACKWKLIQTDYKLFNFYNID